MKRFPLILLIFCCIGFAQDVVEKEVDSLYKEDHFYAGVTYNILANRPSDLRQSGFSLGFHLGFIKDMPINKKRTWAIGLGLGYSANSFNQNLLVSKGNNGNFNYSIIEDSKTFAKNNMSSHIIEIPIEFRWRTSTPTEYNFWRIYTGFKLGYSFINTVKYEGGLGNIKYNDNDHFNNLQYGITLSAGYNTWNLHLYFALNPIFNKDAQLNNSNINMNALKIGLMFYIL
ncbi:porin family protein [Flavisericum labens]|uniref:porin family protein n=1 Tax=Flavisericum labens TaxID=3377112 RepID=UPI00387B4A7D